MNEEKTKEITEDFRKIIDDFCNDLKNTFPEEIKDPIKYLYDDNDNIEYELIFDHCKSVYPERFFDILYQNEDIFTNEDLDLFFLPNIDFKMLWNLNDVTDTIKETIWKYLQLILFSTVGNMDDGKSFGDTAKLFEAVNENDFKDKLKETMDNIQNLFENRNSDISNNINETMPDIEGFQSHLSSMLEGKIGQLAKEIAEETAEELGAELGNVENTNDVLKAMMKNPGKIMNLVKKAGTKLDEKIKSGEIKKSELMEEAGELMKKVGEMPGMDNINGILKQMGVDGMMPNMGGKKGKFNKNAFMSHLNKEMNKEKMKERIKKQSAENKLKKQEEDKELVKKMEEYNKWVESGGMEELLFSLGEKPEKSSRDENPNKESKPKKKKKKGKNK